MRSFPAVGIADSELGTHIPETAGFAPPEVEHIIAETKG